MVGYPSNKFLRDCIILTELKNFEGAVLDKGQEEFAGHPAAKELMLALFS